MKAHNAPEPSTCPTNCLFSYTAINQSYPCDSHCATLCAATSEGLTQSPGSQSGAFHLHPLILDQIFFWDENGPWGEGAACQPSHLQVLITAKFSSDAEISQKAQLWPLLPQCLLEANSQPMQRKESLFATSHVWFNRTKQNKGIGLCSPLLYSGLQVFEADCMLPICELISCPVCPLHPAITEGKTQQALYSPW